MSHAILSFLAIGYTVLSLLLFALSETYNYEFSFLITRFLYHRILVAQPNIPVQRNITAIPLPAPVPTIFCIYTASGLSDCKIQCGRNYVIFLCLSFIQTLDLVQRYTLKFITLGNNIYFLHPFFKLK